ncbi:hypothetical protein HanXRQr2_Chr02g0049911 [Helianthus annuus]|uniref:Uncharacterized protein n=1 Tax=Helianthus annuus TaxID=4232 RepID=A0A9K3NXQ4_HELAN|nr:hypothetical protein HanXRQr2_Chr02g0049911 [Helianthus annuus]
MADWGPVLVAVVLFVLVNVVFVPEVWPVLRLSSKGLFFHIWIQKV